MVLSDSSLLEHGLQTRLEVAVCDFDEHASQVRSNVLLASLFSCHRVLCGRRSAPGLIVP